MDTISLAYKACGVTLPLGITDHFTRIVASLKALAISTLLQDIFTVAGGSSLYTFVRFYSLDNDLTPGTQVLLG